MRLDLPTLDRPAKATSARPSRGRAATRVTPLTKLQGPLNSASPLARSAEVNLLLSVVIVGLDPAIQYLPGFLGCEGGLDCPPARAMTRTSSSSGLSREPLPLGLALVV